MPERACAREGLHSAESILPLACLGEERLVFVPNECKGRIAFGVRKQTTKLNEVLTTSRRQRCSERSRYRSRRDSAGHRHCRA
jgi:hypothetical protein